MSFQWQTSNFGAGVTFYHFYATPPAGGVAVGEAWTAIKHCSKSLGFNQPIHTSSVLLKFGFDVQSQTEVVVVVSFISNGTQQ